jgi:hypothetical protein
MSHTLEKVGAQVWKKWVVVGKVGGCGTAKKKD